jgi:hypothetical protein
MTVRLRIVVENIWTEVTMVFEGGNVEVCESLQAHYPWLVGNSWVESYDVDGLVEELNACQTYEAYVEGGRRSRTE